MKRILLAGVLLLACSTVVLARTVEERLIAGLKTQGYVIVESGYTFFGRLRVVAENATYHREIVVNPETGEVLRDYAVLMADMGPKAPPADHSNAVASTSSSGEGSSGNAGSGNGSGTVSTTTATASIAGVGGKVKGQPTVGMMQTTSTLQGTDIVLSDPATLLDTTAP